MDIQVELERLKLRVAEMAAAMPFGIIGGMSADYTRAPAEAGGETFEFTVSIDPFSEFQEVVSHTFAFRRDGDGFKDIAFREHSAFERLPDLPATDAGAAELTAGLAAWLERVCPRPPATPAGDDNPADSCRE